MSDPGTICEQSLTSVIQKGPPAAVETLHSEPSTSNMLLVPQQPPQPPESGTIRRGDNDDYVIRLPGNRCSAESEAAVLFAAACPQYDQLETIGDACMMQLSRCSSQSFRIQVVQSSSDVTEKSGCGVALRVDVCLVQKIPLLGDVLLTSQCPELAIDAGGHNADDINTVYFNPPGSIWALASVLMLLESIVGVKQWLGRSDVDTTLAAETLVVRCFPPIPCFDITGLRTSATVHHVPAPTTHDFNTWSKHSSPCMYGDHTINSASLDSIIRKPSTAVCFLCECMMCGRCMQPVMILMVCADG